MLGPLGPVGENGRELMSAGGARSEQPFARIHEAGASSRADRLEF